MKGIRIDSGCSASLSSKCVVWNGPKIECLDICSGDTVSEVIYAIAQKVCDIATATDLSTLDLACLIDLCESCPQEKSLKTILQLLLDNQCKLKDLIDDIDGSATADVELNLNLKCIKKFDEFENEIPQNLNQVLQSLVNEVCTHKDKISVLESTVDDLQDQIDNLPPPDTYTEPNITICQAGTPKKLSVAVPLVAQGICDYKDVIGQIEDVQNALSRQCEGLNTLLASTIGWNTTPVNLSQTVNNIWLALCNISTRVRAIEATCCAPSCDRIKLGFIAIIGDGVVSLLFTGGAGTLIPSGFVDCGSIITFIDKDGIEFSPSIIDTPIEQEGTLEDLSIAGLAMGTIKVNIKTKFCLLDNSGAVIMTCQDCFNGEFENTNGCCVITNTGSAQTIIYKTIIN